MRNSVWVAALAAMVALSACGDEDPYSTYGKQDVEGVFPGMEVTNARMMLAPVSGNPAAVYMDIAYSGESAIAISGATVEGAGEVMLHKPAEWDENEMVASDAIPLKPGDTLEFAPGKKHIMVMSPPASFKPGEKAKVTLKIAGARTHYVEASIQAAGEER